MNFMHRADALSVFASRNTRWASIVLFIIAILVRTCFALWLPDAILWIDGQRYVKIAESLLAGQGFGSLEMNKISVPTQPLLIAFFMGSLEGSYTLIRMGFAALGAATVVLIYRLGSLMFEPRVGLLAGLILALYPLHAYTSALFEVPQTFSLLVVAGAFICLFRFSGSGRDVWLLGGGVLFGLSALSVPTVIPFFPAVCVWLLLIRTRRNAWLRPIAAFTVGVVLAMSPWAIRNYLAYDRLIPVNLAGGENFWKANSTAYYEHGKRAATLPCECGTGGEDYCAALASVQAEAARLGLSEDDAIVYADRAGWEAGAAFIRDDPVRFLLLTGRKLLSLFSPLPDAVSSASKQGSTLQNVVSILSYVPILVLGILGILRTRDRWRCFFPVYAFLLTLVGLYSVFIPTVRYRLPIDFFLILFAADWLIDLLRRRVSTSGSNPSLP